MNDWPEVYLLFVTYERTKAALASIASLKRHLRYPNLHWHVCDDGSGVAHIEAVLGAIGGDATWHTMDRKHPQDFNVGGNVNRGMQTAIQAGAEIHLMNSDDFALVDDLDLRPMVDVLSTHVNVGLIRLAYAVSGLSGLVSCYRAPRLEVDYLWLRLIRDWTLRNPWCTDNYIVSMMPYVAHQRFFDAYGSYPENKNPGETEVWMNGRYIDSNESEDAPQILFPIGQAIVHVPYRQIARRQSDYFDACGDIDIPIFEDVL